MTCDALVKSQEIMDLSYITIHGTIIIIRQIK